MCNLLVFVWSPWDLGATAKGVPPEDAAYSMKTVPAAKVKVK